MLQTLPGRKNMKRQCQMNTLIEINPLNFLDKKMDIKEDGHYNIEVHRQKTKLPIHFLSKFIHSFIFYLTDIR